MDTYVPTQPRRGVHTTFQVLGTIAIVILAGLGILVAGAGISIDPVADCGDSHELDCVSTSKSVQLELLLFGVFDIILAAALTFTLRRLPFVPLIVAPPAVAFTLLVLLFELLALMQAPMTNPM